jgi:hypothetical protein
VTRTRLLLAAALLALALLARAYARPAAPVTLARPAPAPLAPGASPAPAAPPRPAPAVGASPTSGLDAPAARALLTALDRARAAAYAEPGAADPDDWAARDCPCHAADAARLRDLARAGTALRGQRTVLLDVTVTRASPAAADLLVTDRLAPYVLVDRAGRVLRRWPQTPPRRWRVTLVRPAGRWLLGAVARAP